MECRDRRHIGHTGEWEKSGVEECNRRESQGGTKWPLVPGKPRLKQSATQEA